VNEKNIKVLKNFIFMEKGQIKGQIFEKIDFFTFFQKFAPLFAPFS